MKVREGEEGGGGGRRKVERVWLLVKW